MVCHEVWHYRDQDHVALLVGFKLICQDCNFVHHLGKASTLDRADAAIQHMMRVNRIPEEEARELASRAFDTWLQRSLIREWAIAISDQLKEEFPFLSDVRFRAS
jgi:hypothetical protein